MLNNTYIFVIFQHHNLADSISLFIIFLMDTFTAFFIAIIIIISLFYFWLFKSQMNLLIKEQDIIIINHYQHLKLDFLFLFMMNVVNVVINFNLNNFQWFINWSNFHLIAKFNAFFQFIKYPLHFFYQYLKFTVIIIIPLHLFSW